ncbi:14992_t:CDS:2, partial [Gigaspora margarita]
NLFKGLQLFQIKNKYNISEAVFNEILKTLKISGVTLYRLQKLLGNIVPFKPTLVDCCINSCIAFTGELVDKDHCPECNEPRYNFSKTSRVSKKNAAYWSIISLLQKQYKNKTQAEYLGGNQIGDIFDGLHYKSLVSSGVFSDHQDIALMASTDRYQIFRQKRDDCWIILLINANLPPDIRVLHENLMISALILGPKAPKNFNSFLRPLVDKLKQLQEGIQCVDGVIGKTFTLRAHVLSWSGDIPALAKVMCTTGHNSYKACHFCIIYYLVDISAIEHSNGSSRKHEVQERGINGRSVLFELKSIKFPDSFPVDIMHGLFENIAPAMLRHWVGSFFKDNQISNSDYVISNNVWTEIGNKMEKNRRSMPLSFGRPPINIQRHSAAFKAEHWLNWITLYSIPLLQNNLLERYLNGWAKFVHVIKLCLKYKISIAELTEIERLFFALISYHYLLHIAASIRNIGPAWSTWQYPMERLCGMLLPL